MAETQTYSYGDFQRYLQHKMSPQEMHDFEKALMDDPFLADALEGFSASDAALAEKHLSEIESQLSGKKQKGKLVAMPLQKKAWWKAVAVVLVLSVGATFTYSLLKQSTDEKTTAQQMAPAEAPESAIKADTIAPPERPLAQAEVLQKKKILNKQRAASPIIQEERREADTTMSAMMKPDSTGSEARNKTAESTGFLNEGADAAAALDATTVTAPAEEDMEARKITSVQEKKEKISERTARLQLSRKAGNIAAAEANTRTATTAEPEGGWKNFEQYLNKQIDSLKASAGNDYYRENIELEFLLDNRGRPTNIKVLEKADSLTAVKAIQLLSAGPKWKSKKKGEKVKVIIPFE